MGNKPAGGGGYSIIETNITTGVGWFIPVTSAWVPYRINYNASGSFGLNASNNVELTPNGNPRLNVSDNMTFTNGNSPTDQLYITNISVVSLSKLPIISNYLYEEYNQIFNFTAKDDDDGQNICFNVSVTNITSTYQSQTSINHYNFTQHFPYGSITITFKNSSYHDLNVSSNNDYTDKTITGTMYPKISRNFTILVYSTTGVPIYFNATISNGTESQITPNNNFYLNSTDKIPYGSITISVQNESYYSAVRYGTNDYTKQIISFYLLPKSNANVILVRFHVTNAMGAVIQNALITVSQAGLVVGQSYTDGTGITYFYLDSTLLYSLTVSATGYSTITQGVTPIINDYYITMGTTSYINFDYTFTNLTWSYKPDPPVLYQGNSIINFTVNSFDNLLEYFGMVLEYNGSVIFNESNNTLSGGGSILVNVNVSNKTLDVVAHPYFKKVGFPEFYSNTINNIVKNETKQSYNTSGQFGQLIAVKGDLGIGGYAIAFMLLLGAAIFVGAVTKDRGSTGVLLAIVVIGIIGFFGIFSASTLLGPGDITYWGYFVWLLLIIIAALAIKWGGLAI